MGEGRTPLPTAASRLRPSRAASRSVPAEGFSPVRTATCGGEPRPAHSPQGDEQRSVTGSWGARAKGPTQFPVLETRPNVGAPTRGPAVQGGGAPWGTRLAPGPGEHTAGVPTPMLSLLSTQGPGGAAGPKGDQVSTPHVTSPSFRHCCWLSLPQ